MSELFGLVLSGGSVRAAAHVGVLKAVEEYKLEPQVVVGTSGGSIVAALYAAGLTAAELEDLFVEHSRAKGEIVDLNWPGAVLALLTWDIKRLSGAVRGRSIEQIIARSLPVQRFQDLQKCHLLIPAVNLNNGQQTVFCHWQALGFTPDENGEYEGYLVRDDLTIAQAVRASISIPGCLYPPPLPKKWTATWMGAEGRLSIEHRCAPGEGQASSGSESRLCRHAPDSILSDGPLEILNQSLDIMMWHSLRIACRTGRLRAAG